MTKQSNDSPALAPRHILVGTGEGAGIQVVTGDIRQALHDSFCCCELPWEQCATEFIKDDVRRLDDPDEWSTDEDGREFSLQYEGEQYSLTVYKDWKFSPALAEPAAPLDQSLDTVVVTHLIGPIVREIYGDTAELGYYKLAVAVYRMNESEVLRLRRERLMLLGELGKAKIRAEKAEASAPSKGMDSGEPSSALTAPTSHQELVEKARKFVHAMGRKPQSSGPTRAATWMLEYATGDTRMDIYELLVAFVESIERAGAESGAPREEKK